MPSPATTVGALPVPAPVGTVNAALPDTTEAALIDYVAFWLRYSLNGWLATQTAPPITDACPVANRWTQAPSDVLVGRQFPALFLYWDKQAKREQFSITQWMRARTFSVLWAFERVKYVEGVNQFSGLISTADAALARAFTRLAHPAYTYGSFAVGTDIRTMFGLRGAAYPGGTEVFLKELPQKAMRDLSQAAGQRSRAKAEGGIQSGYPCLSATITAWEDVGEDTLLDPQDVMQDGSTTISEQGVDILSRVLPAEPMG